MDFIVGLVGEFHADPKQWAGLIEFDPESFAGTVKHLLEHGAIFLTERGLIGLKVIPSIYNADTLIAMEAFFWAPDGRGDALRRVAERWASHRADLICMGSHDSLERVGNWYRRAGYVGFGSTFAKGL